ncbi:hypothetical protein QZH41_010572 [Actinostola sp. cb2023]|nr:hypothetical protein QZH41_010572 [Actinostola sp. cb2023]
MYKVPQTIKDHYKCPPVTLLPERVRRMQEPVPLYKLPLATPSQEEQEEWLKCVVNLQCGIAKHFTQASLNKLLPAGSETSSSVKTGTTNTAVASAAATALAASLNMNLSKDVFNGVKTEIGHSSPSSNVANACISRVVTTTITTSSGGKTVTKPVTILYASPSKLQMNGPLNVAKAITPSSLSTQIAAMASSAISLKHKKQMT